MFVYLYICVAGGVDNTPGLQVSDYVLTYRWVDQNSALTSTVECKIREIALIT